MMLPIDLNVFPRKKGVYIVGGSIRDLLCGRLPLDYDLAVQDNVKMFARQLASRVAGHMVEIGKHGHTILRVVGPDLFFDIMPINGVSIEEDLRQRDFTINAMALEISSGNLIDPVDGRDDLAAKRIRMVSPEVFKLDPVRLIRTYRMAAAFEFNIDADTEAAISRHAELVLKSAAERIREEFFKILHTDGSHLQLARMARQGLLFTVFPELKHLNDYQVPDDHGWNFFEQTLKAYSHLENLFDSKHPVYAEVSSRYFTAMDAARAVLVKWAVLFHKIGKPLSRKVSADGALHYYGHAAKSAAMARLICKRLRFSNRQTDHISLLIRHHRRPFSLFKVRPQIGAADRAFIRFFMQCGDDVADILLLGLAEFISNREGDDPAVGEFTDFILSRIRQYETVLRSRAQQSPSLNGHDLIRELGLKPSPGFKRILKRIEEEHLAGRHLTRKQALEMVQDLLNRLKI
ncbi:MAG: CCA tRNA nucleotidyltransferase [Desulfobacterales bacterium]|nr:MAG: CCA tRNA nucleotidyltransferase [Desulfobacterales bacterium]